MSFWLLLTCMCVCVCVYVYRIVGLVKRVDGGKGWLRMEVWMGFPLALPRYMFESSMMNLVMHADCFFWSDAFAFSCIRHFGLDSTRFFFGREASSFDDDLCLLLLDLHFHKDTLFSLLGY